MSRFELESKFEIVHQANFDLPDTALFLQLLTKDSLDLFDKTTEIFVARAPGRLDVMGGIADYSGSLVLEMPIAEATFVAVQPSKTQQLKIVSQSGDAARESIFEMPLDDFESSGEPISYERANQYFSHNSAQSWAAYVAGVFLVLSRERNVRFASGANIFISSDVPEGKGVSSSAAIETATMSAVAVAFDIRIEPREVALLSQKVENLVVGAPCGVMDQITVVCGEANKLLALLCQPAEVQETIEIPPEIEFWGIDSGVRHSIGGGDYGSVRVGAFMGYRIVAEIMGLTVNPVRTGLVNITDYRLNGYLSNLTPSDFEQRFAMMLPERMKGAEFLERFGGTTDSVTQLDPNREYAVRIPARHAVYENFRVRTFAELLGKAKNLSERRLELLGELMYQSHTSYSACGLGSEGTDLLISLVKEKVGEKELYGAKITGGGSGGTICVLGRPNAIRAIEKIAADYERKTKYRPHIFRGSSPGAASFGYLVLRKIT